ncbi:glycine oxidase ThiO [Acinetobacter sp. ANC 3813]|uniref:glycine oxidase ThiO n=1 Tax=Acinetobacter sp. ANC 3813 TaxID=1977873 RepID=UPI000A34D1AA|nr:glycine oxidase ThiO [Acinetobacter sp. ANC 3813]OTG89086.1 glycine oxidase ThiO [Acinetobacter sp. ANC 3813]
MHIAIIGAGISGLLSALELLEQGCSVSIFDQQAAGKAASWAGGGILSPMYPWRYPQAVNDLAKHGKALYQAWNEKLLPISGIDFEIHETGMLIFDQDDFETGLNYAEKYQEPMQQCEYLQQEHLEQINPRVSEQLNEAIYFPQIANVRNPRLLKSIIAYLKLHPNVQFFENTWIEHFEIQQQKITAIRAANGQHFEADEFVIATGAWSEHWSQQLRLSIPVEPVQGQMLLFKTPENWLPTMCMNNVMYLIPRSDGHIVCGSSMHHLGFDKRPSTQTQQNIYKASLEMVPELENFPVVQQWAGLRPSSPTGVPYIGKMPNFDNLWANFGHYRNGLCMGPASAQLLRQLLLKQPLIAETAAYDPVRLIERNSTDMTV